MNYPCGIIRDLLPLYHDDVCSPESRSAVEQHCAVCTDCRKIQNALDSMPEPHGMAKEADPLRPIQKKWNRERKKSLWIGLGIALFLLLIFVANTVLREWKCVPIGKDDLVVLAVYQTSDGIIHVSYDDLYDSNGFRTAVTVGSDGCGYISAYRPIIAKKTNLPHRTGTARVSFDPESTFAWQNEESLVPVAKVYLGVKNAPEDSILVWEKGMQVRAATAEEEAFYTEH